MNLVFADSNGQVYDHPDWIGLGRAGNDIIEILEEELIPLPSGATLVSLPNTLPIGINIRTGKMSAFQEGCAVGALLPQGFTRLCLPAYVKEKHATPFPLFGYCGVVFKKGKFYVSATATDDPAYWDPMNCNTRQLNKQVNLLKEKYPDNRLYEHLSNCALQYECLTASNTFLQRWEGAVPVSYSCNAACFGCISEQPEGSDFISPQTRMKFRPTVEEIVQVMLEHLKDKDAIISFGQGCEGEPSTQAKLIVEAIKKVRETTKNGYININTNAGLTDHIAAIVDAGLDLMRVSMISAIDAHYNAYYRPRRYTFSDVKKSLIYASSKGVFTSVNHLIFPGVTDREEEIEAFIDFAKETGLRLIQLRNLNIDPESYLALIPEPKGEILGMKTYIEILRTELPNVKLGSYSHTPS